MQGTLIFLRAVARAVVLGFPVAVSAKDVLGTPAVVDGFSMQVWQLTIDNTYYLPVYIIYD